MGLAAPTVAGMGPKPLEAVLEIMIMCFRLSDFCGIVAVVVARLTPGGQVEPLTRTSSSGSKEKFILHGTVV